MFWADELLTQRKRKEWINDSWTPSGMVHMGGLKGPVIHDTLYRILKDTGNDVTFTYGFDDADPIDGLPPELLETHSQYLGIPIYLAPSPDGNGSFGDYYGRRMENLLRKLDVIPNLYRTSVLYKDGTFNKAIQHVLDNAQKVRDVYASIYKKEIATTWYPLQVVCRECGKLGTTKVTGWDGKEVTFSCEPNLVAWAKGCGTIGKMSPFNGNAKMPWKVEWAAKWWTWGVTIEGAGKDHGSAGGSYDVARKICSDVFETEPPVKMVYEFFLSGGKKMSSSKGIGLNGEELLEVLPPDVARYLMIYKQPNQAVEFAPYNTNVIPALFDDFQRVAQMKIQAKTADAPLDETTIDKIRAYDLSRIKASTVPPSLSFSKIVSLIQMPNMKSLVKDENAQQWEQYAQVWLEKYAPESEKFLVSKKLPDNAKTISDLQRQYLQKILDNVDTLVSAEEYQTILYNWTKEIGLSSKDAFAVIYKVLIGKDHGPRAAWLLLSVDKDFLKQRLQEAITSTK